MRYDVEGIKNIKKFNWYEKNPITDKKVILNENELNLYGKSKTSPHALRVLVLYPIVNNLEKIRFLPGKRKLIEFRPL